MDVKQADMVDHAIKSRKAIRAFYPLQLNLIPLKIFWPSPVVHLQE